ncbi:hypothetical protein VB779_03815 [Haloarculaceae archaeon H-GB11]|nr:hypothetical protein [Haloarculaceae archaeon H-GB11]
MVYEALGNRRRRFLLHYLKYSEREAHLAELVDRISAWENDKPVGETTAAERKRVRSALQQFHLPKMDEDGLIEYEPDRKTVSLAAPVEELDIYLDVVPKKDLPWGWYYLGLTGLFGAVFAAATASVYPFSPVSDTAWMAFFIVTLGISGAFQTYTGYTQNQLGLDERPPEVAEG